MDAAILPDQGRRGDCDQLAVRKTFGQPRQANINKQVTKKINRAFGKEIIKDINILVERGSPVKIILKVAEENKCDLIVIGFKGKATLKNATIGSTINKVLQRSKLPVLVINNI